MSRSADIHLGPPSPTPLGEVIEGRLPRGLAASGPVDTPASALQGCLRDIHAVLVDRPEFRDAIAAARAFIPAPGMPAFNATLAQSPSYQLSLLGIHPLRPIPLHDHPGVTGVHRVLAGRLRIRHFELDEGPAPEGNLVRLEHSAGGEYGSGDFDGLSPHSGNIHNLKATRSGAVLLSLQLPPCRVEEQHWYFPLEILAEQQPSMICTRVKKHGPAASGRTGTRAGHQGAGHRETRQ
jgi:hypothetical protein